MSTRRNICVPRKKKDGSTYWHTIGSAFDTDKGTNLVFDSLPLPDAEGRCFASLFEPRERDGGQQRGGGGQDYRGNRGAGRSQGDSYAGDDLDDTPF